MTGHRTDVMRVGGTMSARWKFLRRAGYVIAAAAQIVAFPLTALADHAVRCAVAAGAALSTLNVLAGFLSIEFAFDRSYSTFLKVVLGGMGIRMAVMLGLVLLLLLEAGLHPAAFIGSLFGFYIVYLVLEISYLQQRVSAKNQE